MNDRNWVHFPESSRIFQNFVFSKCNIFLYQRVDYILKLWSESERVSKLKLLKLVSNSWCDIIHRQNDYLFCLWCGVVIHDSIKVAPRHSERRHRFNAHCPYSWRDCGRSMIQRLAFGIEYARTHSGINHVSRDTIMSWNTCCVWANLILYRYTLEKVFCDSMLDSCARR